MMEPRQIEEMELNVTIGINSTRHLFIEVSSPFGTSAAFTIENVTVISSGENLGCFDIPSLPPNVQSSEYSSTQMTKSILDLGFVTNDGTFFNK